MGLDMFLFTTAEISNIQWASKNEANKDKYSRKVILTFSDGTVKEVRAYEIQNIILDTGKNYEMWEIKNITPKGKMTFSHWETNAQEPTEEKIEVSSIKSVRYTHAYWRKANQIHKYFVDNVQNGEDDCGYYDLEGTQLFDLINVCLEVLKERELETSKEKLPTEDGFFFGSTDYDNWYYKNLEDTVKQLVDIKANQTYTYSSSW